MAYTPENFGWKRPSESTTASDVLRHQVYGSSTKISFTENFLALGLNVQISSATPAWTWSDVSRSARTAGTRRLYTPLLALTQGVTSSFLEPQVL